MDSLLLTKLTTFPLSGKWGNFVDYRTFSQWKNHFLFKKQKFKFVYEVWIIKYAGKTNKDKSTEIFLPLYMRTWKQRCIYMPEVYVYIWAVGMPVTGPLNTKYFQSISMYIYAWGIYILYIYLGSGYACDRPSPHQIFSKLQQQEGIQQLGKLNFRYTVHCHKVNWFSAI